MSDMVNCLACKGQGKTMNIQGSRIAPCACCDGSGRVPQGTEYSVDIQALTGFTHRLYSPVIARRWLDPTRTRWTNQDKRAAALLRKGITSLNFSVQPMQPVEYVSVQYQVVEAAVTNNPTDDNAKVLGRITREDDELEVPPWERKS